MPRSRVRLLTVFEEELEHVVPLVSLELEHLAHLFVLDNRAVAAMRLLDRFDDLLQIQLRVEALHGRDALAACMGGRAEVYCREARQDQQSCRCVGKEQGGTGARQGVGAPLRCCTRMCTRFDLASSTFSSSSASIAANGSAEGNPGCQTKHADGHRKQHGCARARASPLPAGLLSASRSMRRGRLGLLRGRAEGRSAPSQRGCSVTGATGAPGGKERTRLALLKIEQAWGRGVDSP